MSRSGSPTSTRTRGRQNEPEAKPPGGGRAVSEDKARTKSSLSILERSRLADEEAAIERGVISVGKALAAIRDGRLYRETHSTFEDYCRDRWGISHRHANRRITAAMVGEVLGPNGPVAESQARELAPTFESSLRSLWSFIIFIRTCPKWSLTSCSVGGFSTLSARARRLLARSASYSSSSAELAARRASGSSRTAALMAAAVGLPSVVLLASSHTRRILSGSSRSLSQPPALIFPDDARDVLGASVRDIRTRFDLVITCVEGGSFDAQMFKLLDDEDNGGGWTP